MMWDKDAGLSPFLMCSRIADKSFVHNDRNVEPNFSSFIVVPSIVTVVLIRPESSVPHGGIMISVH